MLLPVFHVSNLVPEVLYLCRQLLVAYRQRSNFALQAHVIFCQTRFYLVNLRMNTRRTLKIVTDRNLSVLLTFGAKVLDHLCKRVVRGAEQLVDELGLVRVAVTNKVQTVLRLQSVWHQIDLR